MERADEGGGEEFLIDSRQSIVDSRRLLVAVEKRHHFLVEFFRFNVCVGEGREVRSWRVPRMHGRECTPDFVLCSNSRDFSLSVSANGNELFQIAGSGRILNDSIAISRIDAGGFD